MLSGAGGNVTVQLGDQAIVVVDPGTAGMADKVLAAIQNLSHNPIAFIIDTAIDEDHTGGNKVLAAAGVGVDAVDTRARQGAAIVAHVNVLNRMVEPGGNREPSPQADWPTDTYGGSSWKLYNDEPIVISHAASAHTDGDSFVLFRRSDVVSTGDIFEPSRYPVIDERDGGSIDGIIDALNTLIDDVLVPRENEEGGTYVIPGHGHVCDRTDVVNYRDMLTIIRARIEDLVKKGKTLEEVKDAKPTFGFDGLYGSDTDTWTKDMFVEAVYHKLAKDKNR